MAPRNANHRPQTRTHRIAGIDCWTVRNSIDSISRQRKDDLDLFAMPTARKARSLQMVPPPKYILKWRREMRAIVHKREPIAQPFADVVLITKPQRAALRHSSLPWTSHAPWRSNAGARSVRCRALHLLREELNLVSVPSEPTLMVGFPRLVATRCRMSPTCPLVLIASTVAQ
jgi:hypothetical protein